MRLKGRQQSLDCLGLRAGAAPLKENLAAAMNARFVYAIVPNDRIEHLKYQQAMSKARGLIKEIAEAGSWSADERQDWIEDKAAELLHDMPSDFWEDA